MTEKITKTDAEWRAQLTDEQYRVTRKHGTERPGSHEDLPTEAGTFTCVCCGTPLFEQETKFESHCGWPSFYAGNERTVGMSQDNSLGMQRIEVHCNTCDAHLGHVFPDGPQPTGLRYCINGVALGFVPEEGAVSDR
ncbi:peptide-methionine (R)-S-oxide reductase MsrB [Falsirhodobacter halotolerans]|uniref:peptide-methionine (R)-S-oxide reductase MsrB n=1 Tax=Falsirhodobacter halotolerans TaxID=1146892 RepID=UPI001FD56358|nr:peptide-methionine (R)-S-oxide reductase MsrB [Falsirhodobacter halotolerans]MCJ8139738.1 peptide-methionine (R)-S-oxide reductase MsrB [Falsirhodobacter halotolerans]